MNHRNYKQLPYVYSNAVFLFYSFFFWLAHLDLCGLHIHEAKHKEKAINGYMVKCGLCLDFQLLLGQRLFSVGRTSAKHTGRHKTLKGIKVWLL